MSKRKLLNDVTIAEMKRLRDEEDLTNAEVAQRLDVSAVTVWKHLGPKGRKRCAQPDASTVKAFPSGKIWDAAHSLTQVLSRRFRAERYGTLRTA